MKSTTTSLLSISMTVAMLCTFSLSKPLNAQTPDFLYRSFVNGGWGYYRIAPDSLYNDELARPYIGIGQEFVIGKQWILDAGVNYGVYGARSTNPRVYLSMRYLQFPFTIRRTTPLRVDYGFGIVPQIHLNAVSRNVGVHTVLSNNLYYREPKPWDFVAKFDAEMALGGMFNLHVAALASPVSFSTKSLHRHLGLQIGLRLRLGGMTEALVENYNATSALERYLVSLKDEYVIVVLRTKNRDATYYRQQGKESQAGIIEKDADLINQNLMEAFNEYYDYANVLFAYAEDLQKLREDRDARIFLGKNLLIDTTIALPSGANMVCLYPGNFYYTEQAITRKGFYYYKLDSPLEPLEPPFPRQEVMLNVQNLQIRKEVIKINEMTQAAYKMSIE